MHLLKYIAAIVAAAPMMASAASQINAEQVTCSGTQTTDTTNGLQIDCVGSLTIVGGSLTSDEDIKLTASDALYLDTITLTTPKIINLTGYSVSVGTNAKLDSSLVFVNSTTRFVHDGIIHQIHPTFPVSSGTQGVVKVDQIIGAPGEAKGEVTFNPIPGSLDLTRITGSIGSTNGGGAAGGGSLLLTNGGSSPAAGTISASTNAGTSSNFWIFNPNGVDLSNNNACQPTGNPSVFKMIEAGTRYCASGKTQFHQVRFLRTTAECHNLPSTVELAPTQDFPMDSSTIQSTAQCSDVGGMLSSCLLYDAVDGGSNPISQPSVGRLELKWGKKGDLRKLEARIIEKTSDDCHSESTLKFVKKM